MVHDIIMPALGMAQDTGLLVAWRKAPGDRVLPGEALFEVETDKATMEVEAAAGGYLSAVTAGNGEDVPVGQVIARIVATAEEVDATPPKGRAAAEQAKAPVEKAPVVTAPAPPPAPPPPKPAAAPPRLAAPPASGERILASPKARRLAAEAGMDLTRLAKAGHPQPYHVADLDRLQSLAAIGRAVLGARVDGTGLQALLKKATGADSARVFAAFAKGAWRQVTGHDDLTMTLLRADGSREDEGGALLLVDLTGTRLTSYAPPEGLILAVASEGASVTLTLSYDEATLPFAAAAAWVNELAARIEDPVRQLI